MFDKSGVDEKSVDGKSDAVAEKTNGKSQYTGAVYRIVLGEDTVEGWRLEDVRW